MDYTDSGIWHERHRRFCGGLADLWPEIYVYSHDRECCKDELARSCPGPSGSSRLKRRQCLVGLFIRSGSDLLDDAVAFVAQTDFLKGVGSNVESLQPSANNRLIYLDGVQTSRLS